MAISVGKVNNESDFMTQWKYFMSDKGQLEARMRAESKRAEAQYKSLLLKLNQAKLDGFIYAIIIGKYNSYLDIKIIKLEELIGKRISGTLINIEDWLNENN